MLADQVGQNLGIGGGLELVAGSEQTRLQPFVVFDDAVVDDGDSTGLIEVRMRIDVGRGTMSGPAGMADAGMAGGGGLKQKRRDSFVDAPLFFADLERVPVENGDARAVIAAVFEPAQPVDDDRRRLVISNIANNSAHNLKYRLIAAGFPEQPFLTSGCVGIFQPTTPPRS